MGKVIYHIDVNSAFLSWTAAYKVKVLGESLDLRTIPAAICGNKESRHGIILAKSMPAKAYGIITGEPLWQAKQKCPQLVIAAPDYDLYVESSRKFISILKEFAPIVEQYSIDEAWADMSGTEKLYGPPVLAAQKLKNHIHDELGFTVNIGISSNKLLAKMAGDFQKPDLVHTLFPNEIEAKLWPLPVRELFYVGSSTEKKLHSMGIRTIGELANSNPDRLKTNLHKQGTIIWNFANGCCTDEVNEKLVLNKGYGNSITTPQDVIDKMTAHKVLLSLSETVGMRMRKDKQSGCCVCVSLRTNQFYNFSHQTQLSQPTSSTLEIYNISCRIFDDMWDGTTPLRQLGVYVNKVHPNNFHQYSIFNEDNYDKITNADSAIDSIRERFGEEAIIRACFLEKDITPMGGGLAKSRRTGVTKPL